MSLGTCVDVMKETPLFANVDPKRLKLLAFMSETLTYRDGELLMEQGEEGDSAYVLLDGEVSVLVNVGGEKREVARLGQHQVFGEIAILCDVPRTAAIMAIGDIEVLRIGRDVFRNLMKEFPEIAIEMIRILAERLERTTGDLASVRGELAAAQAG